MEYPIIDVQSITFDYADTGSGRPALLDDFRLTLNHGEVVTLLGPSGCGKTTLIRLLAGLLRPQRGTIMFRGQRVEGPARERGVVFQGDTCYPWLTVRQNIAFGLPSRADCGKLDSLLDLVGLSDVQSYLPRQLSFGMRQRVALARAIAAGAQLLLMDEPLSSVDALTRGELQQKLNEIMREHGQASLWVTHDLDEALLLGDKILVVVGRPLRIIRQIGPAFAATHVRERMFSEAFRVQRLELHKMVLHYWEGTSGCEEDSSKDV